MFLFYSHWNQNYLLRIACLYECTRERASMHWMYSVSQACASGWLCCSITKPHIHTNKTVADMFCHEFSFSPCAAVHKFVCLHLHEYVIKRESGNAHTFKQYTYILDSAFPEHIYRMKHLRSGYNITHLPAKPYSVCLSPDHTERTRFSNTYCILNTHIRCVYCLQDYRWQSGFEKGFDLKRSKTHKWNHKVYANANGWGKAQYRDNGVIRTIFIIVAALFHIYVPTHEFILIFNIFWFT